MFGHSAIIVLFSVGVLADSVLEASRNAGQARGSKSLVRRRPSRQVSSRRHAHRSRILIPEAEEPSSLAERLLT